jgi:hypothetical protein
MNVSESHTAQTCSRTPGEKKCELLRLRYRPASDYGKHTGSMQAIGGEIRNIRRQNAERDFNWTVINAMFDDVNDCADCQSDQNAH